MKKTVIVTIEKEIELDIPDEMLTEEHLYEFSSYMFPNLGGILWLYWPVPFGLYLVLLKLLEVK